MGRTGAPAYRGPGTAAMLRKRDGSNKKHQAKADYRKRRISLKAALDDDGGRERSERRFVSNRAEQ